MEYVEKALPESFSLWNLDGYNRTVINTKQGKIYVYCEDRKGIHYWGD